MTTSEIRIESCSAAACATATASRSAPWKDVRVEERDGDWRVVEYRIGAYGALQRLAGTAMRQSLMRAFGRAQRAGPYLVAWDQMDLSDPLRPRLLCAVDALRREPSTEDR